MKAPVFLKCHWLVKDILPNPHSPLTSRAMTLINYTGTAQHCLASLLNSCLFSWFTESPCEKFNFPWATMLERLLISTLDDGPSHAQPARRPFILVRESDTRVKKPPGKWILQSQIFEPSELWLQILWTEKSHAHWAPSESLTPESVSTIYRMVVILQH